MRLNYKIEGAPDSPVLAFSNSLGADLSMWDETARLLLPFFRILRYDNRGHGCSTGSGEDPFTLAQLGQDLLDILDENGIEAIHFCGLSLGGLVGQWLSVHHPDRLKKLVLCNTAAKIGDEAGWNTRIETVRNNGLEAIVEATMDRWFSPRYKQENPLRADDLKSRFLRTGKAGYVHCCAVIRDADFRDQLLRISAPTLVVAGDDDPVTTVTHAEFLAQNISGATLKVLPARHLSATQAPQAFAETLLDFLIGDNPFDRGMHVRRTVLGDAHVDRANAHKTPFNADFQEWITRYAWGEIWSRPGLAKRDRSLITLAMLIALNRKAEFQLHVRAALNNGVSADEIKEVILQSALYCGLPAANEAFHNAEEILNK